MKSAVWARWARCALDVGLSLEYETSEALSLYAGVGGAFWSNGNELSYGGGAQAALVRAAGECFELRERHRPSGRAHSDHARPRLIASITRSSSNPRRKAGIFGCTDDPRAFCSDQNQPARCPGQAAPLAASAPGMEAGAGRDDCEQHNDTTTAWSQIPTRKTRSMG